ncbi:MAG TPA: hypothetical protein VG406_18345 [Isosphaeraceae bacterium]|jgi:hypothetical protein|nr:hypothetical protein [Isosphaeraceae bacterium]
MRRAILNLLIPILAATSATADEVAVDLGGYKADCGVSIRRDGDHLAIAWPVAEGEHGRLVLDLRPGRPLIESMGIGETADVAKTILSGVDPATYVTVGTRVAPPGRPPSMSAFNVFFDAPAKRPHRSYRSRLDLRRVKVSSVGRRATVALGDLTAGPFAGELQFTFYAGARLVHVEAVVQTQEKDCAFLYDAGLVAAKPGWRRVAWNDTEDREHVIDAQADAADRAEAVRHRVIAVESEAGAIACFPPPHQYFFARDMTDNLATVWHGPGHRGGGDGPGFGIRQSEAGGGSFAPWFNAPPGTEQRLGVFYLLAKGKADKALAEALRYTRGDRFADLQGHVTFTSHWHMEIALAALAEKAKGTPRTTPDFVKMFKDMNVQVVHLAEFHGQGHPQDPGPLRLKELDALFDECRRLTDDRLLLLPGEEANVHLGPRAAVPGVHPGHWLDLFPKPVHWTMRRAPGRPFAEEVPGRGTVYHVGNRDDMLELLEREHGLAWTAHPRIKASSWAPDHYRDEDFFKSDVWLGAAWKAMPVDLSRERLGERSLDLLDDMANWGARKQLVGEVDVFKLDHTHELFGHMNINYLRLDRLPRFDDGWQPILDALRGGRFHTTTGEVLLRDIRVAGKESGATLTLPADGRAEVRIDLDWTFPLRFVEVISGDGRQVYRDRIDLADTGPFGRRTVTLAPNLRGRRWVRVEAWDVAANGTFSQPFWIEDK